ncbi:hypothetical protein ACQEU8_36640 [Streptomyces sp. CA-250714]|uniref:hypothetical protein n=1 Tax=Streptomyces sp. CA-250714 TaxID=3240060 RepID=UPI003D8F7E2E
MDTNDQPTGPDASEHPATEPEQRAEAERYLAARGLLPEDRPASAAHNRRRYERIAAQLNAEGIPVETSPSAQLMARMYALFDEYERKTVAARALAGDPNPTDADPLEYVKDIAAAYSADAADTLDDYLDRLADQLTLDDVRSLRLAGEAAQAVTPRVVMAEADRGMKPARIADELGLTQSRVYQILREERQKRVKELCEYAVKAEADAGGDPRKTLARYSAALGDVPEQDREAVEQYLETLRGAVARHQAQQDDSK